MSLTFETVPRGCSRDRISARRAQEGGSGAGRVLWFCSGGAISQGWSQTRTLTLGPTPAPLCTSPPHIRSGEVACHPPG